MTWQGNAESVRNSEELGGGVYGGCAIVFANESVDTIVNSAKYRQLFSTLKREILEGRYDSGRPFPSVRGLVMRFGLTRSTVYRAVTELVNRGLLTQRQGSGTFVTSQGVSRKIGLIMPISKGEIFPPICHEVTRIAQEGDYSIILADLLAIEAGDRVAEAKRIAKSFIEQRVVGVIFHLIAGVSDADSVNRAVLAAFDKAKVPVVLTDCDCEPYPKRSKWDVVGIDDIDAGYRLARHLVQCGAKRIAFFGVEHGCASFDNRMRGYRAALAESHIRPIAVEGDPADAECVKRMLRKSRPDAVIACNDRVAASLLATLNGIGGVRVPQDLQLAGFDDVNYARLVTPRLTTMHAPCAEIGRMAFEALLARAKRPDAEPRNISLSASLVVGGSTSGG